MSGKFMKVKKIFVPALTLLVIASQLTGCGAGTQSELLNMINNQQEIAIEVAIPDVEEQGTEISYEWKELALLDTNLELRLYADDALGITPFGKNGKSGTIYVDLEGNHTDNSTLYYAMMNQSFRNQLDNQLIMSKINEALNYSYVDIESDSVKQSAFINAYFNLIADSEPNYFNASSPLTRAEFLSVIFKAETPVQDINSSESFRNLVDLHGTNKYTAFAEQVQQYGYLNTSDKSLNVQTFDGYITRAEAVYTVVQKYYIDEYNQVTGKEDCYTDAKNAGDIAEKQKFSGKDYCSSYELKYAVQNPDKGMPEELYKAMVVAQQKGLIDGTECRWDEAITKSETISLILKAYENLPAITNVERGNASGDSIESTDTNTVITNGQLESENQEVFEDTEYDIFKNAKEHCTFEYGPSFTLKDAVFTMDDELRAAISDLIPELNEYPEAYREDKLKAIAREISWLDDGERLDTETIRDNIATEINNYNTLGYDEKYGPGPEQNSNNTTSDNQSEQINNQSGNQGGQTETTQQPSDGDGWPADTKWANNPTVVIDDGISIQTYTHTGEYIDGKAVYDNGYGHKYHITESGELQYICGPEDPSEWIPSDGDGAKLSDHLRD